MDENMPPSVAQQLKASGIDVSSVHALEIFSEGDPNLLELATAENRVICTRDADYVRMARAGAQHAGIVFSRRDNATSATSLEVCGTLPMKELRQR